MSNASSTRRRTRSRDMLNRKNSSLQQGCLCSIPYKSLFPLDIGAKLAQQPIAYHSTQPSVLKYAYFALNGRYITCVEVKKRDSNTDDFSWGNASPISQLLLLKVIQGQDENQCQNVHPAEEGEDNLPFKISIAASAFLDLVEVYCVEISNNTKQIAVHGFGYSNKQRKPVISVYEIDNEQDNQVCLSKKTELIFEKSGILHAKLTACKFFPSNDNILVTAICNDYHSVRKTNLLDFWNTQGSIHFAEFCLAKEAPKFQGYVTSMAFSSDGLILAITSSTKYCQLLLHSTQTHTFGPVFSQEDYNYKDVEEHFSAYSSFATDAGDYVLLVCTYHGDFYKFAIDPKKLSVDSIMLNINLFNNLSTINLASFQQPMSALEMKYCPATSRCLVRTQVAILFFNVEGVSVGEIVLTDAGSSDDDTCIAISRNGQELIVIPNQNTLQVHCNQNLDFSLKNICRQSIIQLVQEDRISQLPLPKTLTSYLLYGR